MGRGFGDGRLFKGGSLLTFGLSGWALIRGGRLFESGHLFQ